MDKVMRYFLLSCALIFNANLIYSQSTAEAKVEYLKTFGDIFPKVNELTTTNASTILNGQNANGETLLELVSGLHEYQSIPGGKHLKDIQGDLLGVQYILDLGGNPDVKDINGTTALTLAALTGRYGLVKYLLEHGADKSITNAHGSKAIDYANESLKKYSSDPEISGRLQRIIDLLTGKRAITPAVPATKPDVLTDKQVAQLQSLKKNVVDLRNKVESLKSTAPKLFNDKITGLSDELGRLELAITHRLITNTLDIDILQIRLNELNVEYNYWKDAINKNQSPSNAIKSTIPGALVPEDMPPSYGATTNELLDKLNDLRNQISKFQFMSEKFSGVPANNAIGQRVETDRNNLLAYIDNAKDEFENNGDEQQLKNAINKISSALEFLNKLNTQVAARNSYAQPNFILMKS